MIIIIIMWEVGFVELEGLWLQVLRVVFVYLQTWNRGHIFTDIEWKSYTYRRNRMEVILTNTEWRSYTQT